MITCLSSRAAQTARDLTVVRLVTPKTALRSANRTLSNMLTFSLCDSRATVRFLAVCATRDDTVFLRVK